MNKIVNIKQSLTIFFKKHPAIFLILISLPILVFCLEFLLTGNKIAPGDGDYIMQTHEAARISILEFRQFPWWNPWVSGGVPLYANPQFGLISIQSLTTLLFGAISGFKIAIFLYFLLGFYGFFILFKKAFQTPIITSLLLAYIWTFGSFLVHRASGHYTFFTTQFFPLLMYFYLTRHNHRYSWLWLGLTAGLMANSAAHNTTIMSFFVMGLIIFFTIFGLTITKTKVFFKVSVSLAKKDIVFLLKTAGVFIILAAHRLFYALQYAKDFPREFTSPETTLGIPKAFYAIFGPLRQFENTPTHPVWSWQEASTYIGILTGVVLLIVTIKLIREVRINKTRYIISPFIIGGLAIFFFLLGLGDILGGVSPYRILEIVPVVSEMRVATRWLFWSAMMILLFIGLYRGKDKRTLINLLLLLSVIELFVSTRPFLAKPYIIEPASYTKSSVINQQIDYDVDRLGIPYDENLTATTRSNIGQVIAGDALVDTRFAPPFGEYTNKCDEDEEKCSFVLTKNADVVEWTPNKITLQRTGPGGISLNMNPGKGWVVNGVYTFRDLLETDANKFFILNDDSDTIVVEYIPKFSHKWFWNKIL